MSKEKGIDKKVLARMGAALLTLGILAVAAWGLKMSIDMAARNEEDKVVSDRQGQQEPLVMPEVVDAESILSTVRVFNDSSSGDQTPSDNEVSERQAAALMVNAMKKAFGIDCNRTILQVTYSDHNKLPPELQKIQKDAYRELNGEELENPPPCWHAMIYFVNVDKYKDCATFEEFSVKYGAEANAGREQQPPTNYSCEMNALTGEINYVFEMDYGKLKSSVRETGFTAEEKLVLEQKYRDYALKLFPDLTIVSVEFVTDGAYYQDETYVEQCIVTLSDGSGLLFEDWDLCLVKYFPKGVPEQALGH